MRVERVALNDQIGVLLTPSRHIRMGRSALPVLRGPTHLSETDRKILANVEADDGAASFVVLRGRTDDGSGSWGFEEALSRSELEELAYAMVRAQLFTWRTFARAGLSLFIKVEWGAREIDAIGAATVRIADELKEAEALESDPGQRARLKLDAWIAANLSYWLHASYSDCKASFLPRALRRVQKRAETLRTLIERVPPHLL